MFWIKALVRPFFSILAKVILPIPTLYATLRKLDRLPWGLNYIFGCTEDGWNGTGCDPSFPRQFWKNVDGKTIQGWYPDYLGVIWKDLPWYKQWYHSYVWCAWRNTAWNLRMVSWYGVSVHFKDIEVTKFEKDGNRITVVWIGSDGKTRYFKRRDLFGKWCWEFGHEFYYDYFDPSHKWYHKLRAEGYTFNVTPFKDRSIPSVRPRAKLNKD
jgi:hypothetical protein